MSNSLWQRYQQYLCVCPTLDLSLDISRMTFADGYFAKMVPAMANAYQAMDALEKGAIANPDEKRMVGHYWLRASQLAPSAELRSAIDNTRQAIKKFAADVHAGKIKPPTAVKFTHVLSI